VEVRLREGKALGSELCCEQRSCARVLSRMIGINFYIKTGRAALDSNFYLSFGGNIIMYMKDAVKFGMWIPTQHLF
jgi:hypothetical protein